MKRITVSLPEHLYKTIDNTIPKGEVSGLVVEALEKELAYRQLDPISKIRKLQKNLPPITTKKILWAIRKGRT